MLHPLQKLRQTAADILPVKSPWWWLDSNDLADAALMSFQDFEKGTVSIAFVREALVCLQERGLDEHPMLLRAGISPELLSAPQSRVSATQYGALWLGITAALDDEFFSLDSHPLKAGSFTLLCHSLIHSETLEVALRRALRFLRVTLDDFAGELDVQGDISRLRIAEKNIHPKRFFAYGTYFLILHGLACWLIGRRIPITEAEFRCAEPDYSKELRFVFSNNLQFAHAHSSISFSSEYLQMGNIQNERTMKEFLRLAPGNFLVLYKNSSSLSAKIRRHFRSLPPTSWPNFATLAHQLHTSEATLRRRLDDEGVTYQKILDDLRRDLAVELLSNSEQSLAEIADALGFSEASAFHRAFGKWMGIKPGEYRKVAREHR